MTGGDPQTSAVARYAEARQALLARVAAALSIDERFMAAWVSGSLGRGQADAVSDLDLTVVVVDGQRDRLCARPWMVGAGTTAARLSVLRQFGEPAIIHENHYNAPRAGTFTFTLYAGSALMVDWVFVPLSDALRPPQVGLLFAHADIPLLSADRPAPLSERIATASERVSFFWMRAAVAARYRARRDLVSFHSQLQHLERVASEIRELLSGEPQAYRAELPLLETPAAQAAGLRRLCAEVLAQMPEVEALGGHVPPSPMAEIELLIGLRE